MSRIIRVDQHLANVLDLPRNTKTSFYNAVALLDAYVAKRKLDDPESNALDDADPDRHLDSTVVLMRDLRLYCARCNHHLLAFELACRRCGLKILKADYKTATKMQKASLKLKKRAKA